MVYDYVSLYVPRAPLPMWVQNMKYMRFLSILSIVVLFAVAGAAHAAQPGDLTKQYPGDDSDSAAPLAQSPDVTSVTPPEPVEPPATGETGEVLPPNGKPPKVIPPPISKATVRITNPKNDHIAFESGTMTIRWVTTGEIPKVRLYYYGDRTQLGGHSRGDFGVLIADSAPNTGSYTWTVPWVDASAFRLRIAGLDGYGRNAAADEMAVQFRPKEMETIKDQTFILVSKRHQRLWFVKDGHLKRLHIVSTALDGFWTPTMKPGSYDPQRGAMGKVFDKDPAPMSNMYHVIMPWWLQITASGSHGIHATSPRFYDELGGPASHGCVRQHRADAEVLYSQVKVGTPVYVF
jgi:lipoprotein-anchoring transpeptidase ErfK/SrfK